MYLNQLAKGSILELSIMYHGEKISFPSEIIHVYDELYNGLHCVGSRPVIADSGKPMSFGNLKITIIATNSKDHRKYRFFTSMQGFTPKGDEYLLLSKDDSEPINYRGAHRIPCDFKTVMQIGENKHTVNGYVHDVSFLGISFLFFTEDYKDVKPGSPVSASLYITEEHIVKVYGEVVRYNENFSDKMALVGVRFTQASGKMTSIIANLQRRECRIARKMAGRNK